MTKQVEAFKLTVPDTDIVDLRERLRRTRFPDQAPAPAWACGTDIAWMRGLIDYWRGKIDWRAQEARLNAFPQVTSMYISFKSRGKDLTRVAAAIARLAGLGF